MPTRDKRGFVKLDDGEHRRFIDKDNSNVLWKRRGFSSFSAHVRALLYEDERKKK